MQVFVFVLKYIAMNLLEDCYIIYYTFTVWKVRVRSWFKKKKIKFRWADI